MLQGESWAATRVSPTGSHVGCTWEAIGVEMPQPFGAHTVPIVLVAMGFNTCPDGLWSYFGPINSFLYSHFFFLEWECDIVGGSVDKVFAMRV